LDRASGRIVANGGAAVAGNSCRTPTYIAPLIQPVRRIEFMLSPKRDLIAAKLFLRLPLYGGEPSPRVINVDGHAAYARHCRVEADG
jgi:hypothetical protein